jgi:glycosyltransferase involved in cell wall biosynthesis
MGTLTFHPDTGGDSRQSRTAPDGPKITLIIASYNTAEELRPLLESYRRQTYPNKELVFVDGGSTDGTRALMEEYASIIDRSISEPDEGIMDAWNKALGMVTGDWIQFLGAGDQLCDDHVYATLVEKYLSKRPESKVVYGYSKRVDAEGQTIEVIGAPWDRRCFREVSWQFSQRATFHHRSFFEEYGVFDTRNSVHGAQCRDYEILLRYLKDHDALFAEMPITCEDTTGYSSRPENRLKLVREVRRARRLHGVAKWRLSSELFLWKAYLKFILWKVLPYRPYLAVLDGIRRLRGMRSLYTRR